MKKYKEKGITLIALVITIIVLLILAGVAIATLTGDNGILTKAVIAKENTEKAAEEEASELKKLENMGTYNTGTTVAEAIAQDLPYEINTTITDELGNKITVPAGFKIVRDNPAEPTPTVKDGIVIQDAMYEETFGSEFIWIPVGNIKKSETETVKINLSRYTFNETTGEETDEGTKEIWDSYTEDTKENHGADYKNAIATDINDFIDKTKSAGGYYIGRYEARVKNSTLDKTEIEDKDQYSQYIGSDPMWTGYKNGSLVTKPNSQVWNYITQNKASELSKNMYRGKPFVSDLINSYAWDTAIVFIQKVTNENYANQNSLNTKNVANQGTNNLVIINQDKICNIWDMASNCYEWTTESRSSTNSPCVGRGGLYSYSDIYTASRNGGYCHYKGAFSNVAFRPILYL